MQPAGCPAPGRPWGATTKPPAANGKPARAAPPAPHCPKQPQQPKTAAQPRLTPARPFRDEGLYAWQRQKPFTTPKLFLKNRSDRADSESNAAHRPQPPRCPLLKRDAGPTTAIGHPARRPPAVRRPAGAWDYLS